MCLHAAGRAALRAAVSVVPALILAVARPAAAQPDAGPSASAEVGPPAPRDGAGDAVAPDVAVLEQRAAQVRALLDGTLDPAVDAASLFDVPLDDERAIAVEIARLRTIVDDAGTTSEPVDAGAPDADAGAAAADAGAAAADAGIVVPAPAPHDAALYAARLALDRARLSFYRLPRDEREARLSAHAARRTGDAEAERELSDAEAEQARAEQERQRALEQAQRARTNAEKLASEELARLFQLKGAYARIHEAQIKDEQSLEALDETLLGWTLPADEIIGKPPADRPPVAAIDRVYGVLTEHLAETRAALDAALSDAGATAIPAIGSNPLIELPVKVDTAEVDALRDELWAVEQDLRQRADALRWRRSGRQLRALEALDERRLALIPLLSADKRAELEGLGPVALTQARDELSKVVLLLRYHLGATRRYVTQVRETGETGDSTLIAVLTALQWLLPMALFAWWRRRADGLLSRWNEAAAEAAAKNAIPRGFSRPERVIAFARRVRSPLEWLLLVWAVLSLLPAGAAELLEVQLLSTILTWTLGGWLVVAVIDALLSDDARKRKTALQTAHIRWRTLRWLGRLIVGVGLFLALAERLVGQGTIYSWALWVAWTGALVVALQVMRWWRPIIFHHVGLSRKKGPLMRWVERHETGWISIPAVAVGGVVLAAERTIKLARQYLGGFDLVRRLLAYWFRREVARHADKHKVDDQRLPEEIHRALDPAIPSDEIVASSADTQLEDIVAQIQAPGGRVLALVGERGSGKTTILSRIAQAVPETAVVRCPTDGIAGFARALREAIGLPADASDDAVCGRLDEAPRAVLVDDAHHLVRPVVDGLEDVDRVLALARRSATRTSWLFAFDEVIWQFFSRAREVLPLFDETTGIARWTEADILRLIEARCEQAGIEPDYSPLVTEIPEGAEEIDLEEALERAQNGYIRLLWDYSLGNPAVTLQFWRASLRPGPAGRCSVQLFDAPPSAELDRLPDSTVFVMRAVVQLDHASRADILDATMLDESLVDDALRYGLSRKYLERVGEHYHVRWTWFRTLTRFLVRRHLLLGPAS